MNPERNKIKVSDDLKRKILQAARDMRKNSTSSESLLWQELRGKQLNGIKFRRQQPIGPFVVDFYAPSLRLVIEIDGAVHQQQQEEDRTRQMILESLDLTILRFSASQVETEIASVLTTITLIAEEIVNSADTQSETSSPTPSPINGEGKEGFCTPLRSSERGQG